ncbi:unnamed protein product [Nyctereutes procyonoides]|uniref:(raccoon dog) hypothetical protein n=1 Tax=Nyctereutes procyonoides TaxID=34880 RepID=A0A811YRS1_NYCPR|nr:unnamed protein product [Nyctereutes procyonoides]
MNFKSGGMWVLKLDSSWLIYPAVHARSLGFHMESMLTCQSTSQLANDYMSSLKTTRSLHKLLHTEDSAAIKENFNLYEVSLEETHSNPQQMMLLASHSFPVEAFPLFISHSNCSHVNYCIYDLIYNEFITRTMLGCELGKANTGCVFTAFSGVIPDVEGIHRKDRKHVT